MRIKESFLLPVVFSLYVCLSVHRERDTQLQADQKDPRMWKEWNTKRLLLPLHHSHFHVSSPSTAMLT